MTGDDSTFTQCAVRSGWKESAAWQVFTSVDERGLEISCSTFEGAI